MAAKWSVGGGEDLQYTVENSIKMPVMGCTISVTADRGLCKPERH